MTEAATIAMIQRLLNGELGIGTALMALVMIWALIATRRLREWHLTRLSDDLRPDVALFYNRLPILPLLFVVGAGYRLATALTDDRFVALAFTSVLGAINLYGAWAILDSAIRLWRILRRRQWWNE